ncbi:MAG: FtsX-like permease family protein, partial [Bacteroidales bacterium]
VLEQTQTIGILKSLGMKTKDILNIFLLLASKIMIKGLLLGNIISIVLCLIQKYFHLIKLDAATYYVSYVPITFNIPLILVINIGVLFVCILVLAIPAYYVAKKISPVTAIRFE